MRRGTKIAIAAGAVVVAAVGGGLAWYILDDDAPPPVALPDAEEAASAATDSTAGSSATDTTASATAGEGISGEWTVAASENTFVGYRVDEVLAGINKTAVGRSPAVAGTVVVEGTTVTDATFTADLTQLQSDESRRDNRIRTLGLETDTFPEATFTLTEPIDLGAEPVVGEPFTAPATGDLTLHGVTRPVTIDLEARLDADGTVVVIGSLPILFADYDIEKPDVAGFVTTEDNGVLELSLVLERA